MTNEEYEEFRLATDPLKPLAPIGYFSGLEGGVTGFAALGAYVGSAALDLPDVLSFGIGLIVAFIVGMSWGKQHWDKYHRACDAHLSVLRRSKSG